MKTLHLAVERAKKYDIDDVYLYVSAILMSKIAQERQQEFSTGARQYSYRIPDLLKFHQN
jgi:hypothetical protein